ncbi:hypothetical protein AVEN_89355-1 [Araneus ventricosus]|uniref:Tc1-like transposase DDE domain-containing protein n=1 Tax=Araneus ventricosus TaxID=182803 RepID=A0A4Y2BWW2_ARAVE|nr:hypothetical protein AVEN_89355-1 [Araneus ventricosus]
MFWGIFSWAALGPVVVVEQTMKAANYLNIIADQLHPYMAFVFPTGNGIFQQDKVPFHKARIVLEWFEAEPARTKAGPGAKLTCGALRKFRPTK